METHPNPLGPVKDEVESPSQAKLTDQSKVAANGLTESMPLSPVLRITLVVASAVLMPLCFEPFCYWPLVMVAAPMLIIATVRTSSSQAFYLGLIHGTLSYGISLHWLFGLFSVAAIPIFALIGLFTGIFCLLNNYFAGRAKSDTIKILLCAVLWTAIEFYRCELFILRFPWITPGTSIGPTFISPVVGVYGTSFLITLSAACWQSRRAVPLAIWLSLGIMALGMFKPAIVAIETEDDINVAIVQSECSHPSQYQAMTTAISNERPDLVIWPELAIPFDVRKNQSTLNELIKMCGEMDTILITGTKTTFTKPEPKWHQTALALDESGVIGEYHKMRPVHFFNDGSAGKKPEPVSTTLGRIGTPICFDCDYTAVIRQITVNGAEFFAIPSYDAKRWGLTQHLQHAALFPIRAAENARWIACAASSGVSQVIDPNGNVHASIPAMEESTITCRIGKRTQKTFFTKAGWILPWITLCCTGLLLLKAAIRTCKNRAIPKDS